MSRIFLIARREYAAYAKTVGFWLSLLAFPLFAVLGASLPVLMKSNEQVREVVLIEEGAEAQGLAAAVREALREDAERRAALAAEAARKAQETAGAAGGGVAGNALAALTKPRMRLVATPPAISEAVPGKPQDEVVRHYLGDDVAKADRLDAVVFLTRENGVPAARVWSARATDDTVQGFVRSALKAANRKAVLERAGIDPAIVSATERFQPEVVAFSPQSSGAGKVEFRDKLPQIIGLAGGFLLWSLVLTGASILLNSVMEEKSNKILEVLLSSASATEILTGKVLGVAMLTLTMLLAWGGIGAAGLLSTFPAEAAMVGDVLLNDGLLGYFAAFMVGGYLMYAVLFAAIGAFCETPRDAQTLMGPIMMVLIIPILTMQMAFNTPDAPLIRILSMIPFFTPFVMMARLPSNPPMIELIGSIAGMFVFALFMVWVAGRAFRAGALSDVKLSWKSFAGAIRGGAK
ncbi:MAG: ABC transporter permease [Rhodoferax sp.]|uniref:ABC transporter permease n=1 Tax=Rhodoferax sp. TaxID=50421 RepID=UPI00272FFB25|nr:ABC transporter permease [Rhodoferax sp.]MDP1528592.1 ABC transporter permease [Rhodoferax sp.]